MYVCLLGFSYKIVKGLAGTSDSVTNSVEIKRIPVLYENLVASVKTFNFVNFNFFKTVGNK